MKGFTLQPVFLILLSVFVIFISALILLHFFGYQLPIIDQKTDVRYACSNYNNTRVSFEQMKTIIYGFLTDQCGFFNATLGDSMNIQDIKTISAEIDNKISFIEIDNCRLPSVNSHSVYICCSDIFRAGKSINITRREIKNSDVLICGDV